MLLREEEYSHATAILSGMEEKTLLFTELEQWFEETYGLRVYDYFCGLTNAGRPGCACFCGTGTVPGR